MDDMKEKLIELLLEVDTVCRVGECEECIDDGVCFMHRAADNLIANGVTVPIIPIGSTVYALYQHNGKKNNFQIRTNSQLKYSLKFGTVEIREKKCVKNDAMLLVRLVFRTKEEAEAAIAPKDGDT